MKKQIITVVSVALVAVLLFTTYSIFLKDDGIEEVADPFYVLTDKAIEALENIDGDVTLTLCGYDSADEYWTIVYRFTKLVAETGDFDFEPDGSKSGFEGVTVNYEGDSGDVTRDIEFDSFFKTLYNGTRYAFDGEALLVNGVLELAGKESIAFELRALDGYDTDGDQVTATGYPFMFPSIDRSSIEYLTINNSHGKYSIYQYDNAFYFDVSAAIKYNEEMFAQLTTNCRYVTTLGKMDLPEDRKWADYGLALDEPSTASYTILTTEDKDGNYYIHSVYIGNLASTGTYYYARYVGGLYNGKNAVSAASETSLSDAVSDLSESVSDTSNTLDVSDTSDTSGNVSDTSSDASSDTSSDVSDDESAIDKNESRLVHNLTRHDTIFFMPISAVDQSIALPQTDIMEPTIMTAITSTDALFSIEDIRIDYNSLGMSALAKNMDVFNAADNLSMAASNALTKVISNKKNAGDYASYSDGWLEHTDVFGGFTSSDGKATYIEAALARACQGGEYKIQIGVLRDEANGAYLPAKITVSKSYDGINWHEVENCAIRPEQSDKQLKKYEASFTDTKTVKYIRFAFDVPQKAYTYVVFDEIRIFADGEDAQPESAISGTWKLVSPTQYIPEGHLFTYLDMTNFNDFVQSIAAIEGERVVDCGFSDNGNATASLLKKDILEKYGLANPETHYSFTYDGVVFDVYVSAPNAEGKYYAYATYSGDNEGKHVIGTSDVIVELSTASAKWLEWDIVEYLDHSLLSMFLVDITEMEITFGGKEYAFDLTVDAEENLTAVSYNGKNYDVQSFKYLYQTILSISMYDEYIPEEGEDVSAYPEYMRIKIHTESTSPEFVFYRVSATRCYFTVDGTGSYYALIDEVDNVMEDVLTLVSGQKVEKR